MTKISQCPTKTCIISCAPLHCWDLEGESVYCGTTFLTPRGETCGSFIVIVEPAGGGVYNTWFVRSTLLPSPTAPSSQSSHVASIMAPVKNGRIIYNEIPTGENTELRYDIIISQTHGRHQDIPFQEERRSTTNRKPLTLRKNLFMAAFSSSCSFSRSTRTSGTRCNRTIH